MTDDAMKRAFEAWLRTQDRPLSGAVAPLAKGFFEIGFNAGVAHHYADVHELRDENDRLWLALIYIAGADPEIVAAVEKRYGLDVARATLVKENADGS